ncbi:hypothetical protein KKD04_00500 [Patescibacteria group bacterium]|nr:hypothetical protein [Patescibacteria group bacterium]
MLFNWTWKEILRKLNELSKDESKIEKIIEKQMIKVIKEIHPIDHQPFIERNKEQLEKIKLKLKKKYSEEIHRRISNLISL